MNRDIIDALDAIDRARHLTHLVHLVAEGVGGGNPKFGHALAEAALQIERQLEMASDVIDAARGGRSA